jgi:hypothetical protein
MNASVHWYGRDLSPARDNYGATEELWSVQTGILAGSGAPPAVLFEQPRGSLPSSTRQREGRNKNSNL